MHPLLDWWLRQLAGLPHLGLGQHRSDAAATILDIRSQTIALLARRPSETVRIAEASRDEAGFHQIARALSARRGMPPRLVLGIGSTGMLRKRLSLPLAARANLETLLGFEMDRETPFAKDEVYWSYVVHHEDRAQGRLELELVMIPRPAVDPFLEAARRAGLVPSDIEVEIAANETALLRLGGASRRRSPRAHVALAAAACVLAVVAVTLPFVRQHQALASADAAIAALTPQAQDAATLRQSIDRAAGAVQFLATERERTGNTLGALAALTRVLPDTTYLTAFSLRGGRLTLTGLSPSAADLVGSLARSPSFREPAFAAPIVQSESGGLELFTITVTLPSASPS